MTTGPTHHAPSTGITSHDRQRRRDANPPKREEREVLHRVNALRNEPAHGRHHNEYRAWRDLGTAVNLFEGCYYADEDTSDPAYDAPTTRR